MQAVLKPTKQFEYVLGWCLLASILLHIAFLFGIPKPSYETTTPPQQEIHIALEPKAEPPKEDPPPEPPKPPAPTPVKPIPVKPLPQKVEPLPAPIKPPSTPAVEAPPVIQPVPTPVIAAKPVTVEPPPEVVVVPPPPVEPPKETGPSEGEIEAARNAFRSAAHKELRKNQRYPRIAQDRGIEGDVKLNIHLDGNGNVVDAEVVESSGNRALDEAALTAAKKSNLKPHFHEVLHGRIQNIVVTVSFKLVSG